MIPEKLLEILKQDGLPLQPWEMGRYVKLNSLYQNITRRALFIPAGTCTKQRLTYCLQPMC